MNISRIRDNNHEGKEPIRFGHHYTLCAKQGI